MLQALKSAWDDVSLWLSGWKTHLAAASVAIVNVYDAVAQYLDWSKIFSDPQQLMFFNVGMAILIMIFREMASTAQKVSNLASEAADNLEKEEHAS